MKKQFLEAGKIVGTHGVRGELKIQPWADSPAFLTEFDTLYVGGSPMAVRSARVHKHLVITHFADVTDMDTAVPLIGKIVEIDRADAPLPPGSFFIQDILGLPVVDEQGETVGRLTEVLSLPAGDVYVVQGQREYLIPDVPAFILEKNLEAGLIRVRLIEGM